MANSTEYGTSSRTTDGNASTISLNAPSGDNTRTSRIIPPYPLAATHRLSISSSLTPETAGLEDEREFSLPSRRFTANSTYSLASGCASSSRLSGHSGETPSINRSSIDNRRSKSVDWSLNEEVNGEMDPETKSQRGSWDKANASANEKVAEVSCGGNISRRKSIHEKAVNQARKKRVDSIPRRLDSPEQIAVSHTHSRNTSTTESFSSEYAETRAQVSFLQNHRVGYERDEQDEQHCRENVNKFAKMIHPQHVPGQAEQALPSPIEEEARQNLDDGLEVQNSTAIHPVEQSQGDAEKYQSTEINNVGGRRSGSLARDENALEVANSDVVFDSPSATPTLVDGVTESTTWAPVPVRDRPILLTGNHWPDGFLQLNSSRPTTDQITSKHRPSTEVPIAQTGRNDVTQNKNSSFLICKMGMAHFRSKVRNVAQSVRNKVLRSGHHTSPSTNLPGFGSRHIHAGNPVDSSTVTTIKAKITTGDGGLFARFKLRRLCKPRLWKLKKSTVNEHHIVATPDQRSSGNGNLNGMAEILRAQTSRGQGANEQQPTEISFDINRESLVDHLYTSDPGMPDWRVKQREMQEAVRQGLTNNPSAQITCCVPDGTYRRG